MAGALLSIEGLTLERGGRRLFENFSLSLAAGEFVQVEGENGSGKTTLLRYMAGLSGSGSSGMLRRSHGALLYLGHKPAIKSPLSPRENLRWYCRVSGWREAGIGAALDQVGLFGYEDVPCQALSAGQQRRANLARLYLCEAALWLLDEPFTSIDAPGTEILSAHLAGRAQRGAAVVVASHQALPVDYPLRRVQLGNAA